MKRSERKKRRVKRLCAKLGLVTQERYQSALRDYRGYTRGVLDACEDYRSASSLLDYKLNWLAFLLTLGLTSWGFLVAHWSMVVAAR